MNHHPIPSALRFAIARVTDLALDVALAGRYDAYTYFAGNAQHTTFTLRVMPRGKRHTDPEAHSIDCPLTALTHPGWGGFKPEAAQAHCQRQLGDMADHLEGLLDEGPTTDAGDEA